MGIRQILAGVLLTGFSAFTVAQSCPAVDCDCSALETASWRSICQNSERAIARECSDNGGKPQSYCRMHGPEGFPVATSTKAASLPHLPNREWNKAELNSREKQVTAALWSLQEDLKSMAGFLRHGDNANAAQVAKLLEKNSERLFLLQREVVGGWASVNQEKSQSLALEYNKSWQDFTSQLEAYSERLLTQAASQDESGQKLYKQLGYKMSRMAAGSQEFAALVDATAGDHKASAQSWQQAASISEQLVTRSRADGAPERHIEFYREQATARWFRATYHWLQTNQPDEAQVSFQNAEHISLQGPTSAVADALDGAE